MKANTTKMYEFRYYRIIITLFLVLLFAYTSVDKLINAQHFGEVLAQHPIPAVAVPLLQWMVPGIEILITLILLVPVTRQLGLYSAMLLLVVFTIYLAIVLTGAVGTIPCGCGGVFTSIGWREHILLNSMLIASILWVLYGHRIILVFKSNSK